MSAPSRGMRSATNCASGQGPRRAGGGPKDFAQDLVRWARALAWMPGPAEVSWAELALDYEAFVGRALRPPPDHRLRGTRLPLGERAQILRKAARLGGLMVGI